jgi:DNA-binding protein YbaB
MPVPGRCTPDAVARLEERRAAFERTVAATQEMATRMQALTATASDANGIVTVTVNAEGGLLGAEFSARMQRTVPEAVSRALMEALAEAKRRIAGQTQEVIADTVGADSGGAATTSSTVSTVQATS